jgi:hypothetical protein
MGVHGDEVYSISVGYAYNFVGNRIGNWYFEKPIFRLSIFLLGHGSEIVQSGGPICLLLLSANDYMLSYLLIFRWGNDLQ